MTPAPPVEWGLAVCLGAIGVACLVFAITNLVETVRDARRGGWW